MDSVTSMDFGQLQRTLSEQYGERGELFHDSRIGQVVVVNPSLTLSPEELSKIHGVCHFEERLLCQILLLGLYPRLHMVYLSSTPIDPIVVDYFVSLVPNLPHSHISKRLHFISPRDRDPTLSLTDKLLKRPLLMRRIKRLLQSLQPYPAHMSCFIVTPAERELALILECPIYGCDPDLLFLGTKSGSREAFRNAEVRLPDGSENLRSGEEVVSALVALRLAHPHLRKAVVKLNDGFSGEGNAVFLYRGLTDADEGDHARIQAWVADALERNDAQPMLERHFLPQSDRESWATFQDKIQDMGAIVEAFVGADAARETVVASPSCQIRVTPVGEVVIISTHDQVLDGQVYKGCTFPCDASYRVQVMRDARRVGEVLARRGALGRFAIDFMVTCEGDTVADHDADTLRAYAIEINLRKGGTTHPFNLMDYLVRGELDQAGDYRTPSGETRVYFANDHVESPDYYGMSPEDLIDVIAEADLVFNQATQKGVVFHNIGALSQYGAMGMVAIAETIEEAKRMFDRAVHSLDVFVAANVDLSKPLFSPRF